MSLIPDHYTINIAKRHAGYSEHYFLVELPTGRTKAEALAVFDELTQKYPAPEYNVTLTRITCRGTQLRASDLRGVGVLTDF